MQSVLAAFCAGILLLACPYPTPGVAAITLCGLGLCLLAMVSSLRANLRAGLFFAVLAGYAYGTFNTAVALDQRLPACSDQQFRALTIRLVDEPVVLGESVAVEGTSSPGGLRVRFTARSRAPAEARSRVPPEARSRVRFAARVVAAKSTDCPGLVDRTLRLTWYNPPELHAGDVWQVTAKVRPPWSYQNPGGFDYERWLLSEHLHGTGYVREGIVLSREFDPSRRPDFKQQIREWLLDRQSPHTGVVFALLTGDGSLISPAAWREFRATGTVHLVVVSGLHVGIVAGAAFLFGQMFARAFPIVLLWVGARRFATLFGVLVTGGYVAFSGYGVPAMRAWIMTSIMLIAFALGRRFSVALMFTIALSSILIWDPLAVHQQGFWLSFSAVAALIWYFSLQLSKVGRVRQLLLVQWVLLVVMVPLLASANGAVPVISPVVNLLVVPLMTLLVLPLSFVTGFAIIVAPWLATFVFAVIEFMLDLVDFVIHFCAQMPQVNAGELSTMELLLLGITIPPLLATPCVRRMIGLLPAWLSWCVSVQAWVPLGEFQLTALDVGQGSAIVIDTSAHRLLFDTAPRFPGGFDLGETAVVPAVIATGRSRLDTVVLSHDDIDHTGGFAAVYKSLQPLHVWAAESIVAAQRVGARPCRAGVQWRWDGVDFRFLHPPAGFTGTDNEKSCVLLVDNGRQRALLPGDIGRATERRIIRGYKLNVDVLLAPHHGSNASSADAWVRTLQPSVVMISAPRRSQYGHPHPAVVARYENQAARVFVTGLDGALQWRSWHAQEVLRWRPARGAYWTNQLPLKPHEQTQR